MRVPRPRTLLFDWDNTLVDTWPAIHDALRTTFEAMGKTPWTFEQTKARVRRSAREAFPALFGERAAEAAEIFYTSFEATHLRRLCPCPGAQSMLANLATQGYDLAVISNKQGPYLRREADRLGWSGYFRRIVGAGDADHDKPSPVAVALALSGGPGEYIDRRRVWFVGDTDIDLSCAVAAGCLPVLLRPDPPAEGEFGDAAPSLYVPSCDVLAMLLSQQQVGEIVDAGLIDVTQGPK